MRILVLDDDPQIRRLLRRVLTPAFGRDGGDCRRASTGPFDLAVLDLNLPDGTGADVAEALLKPPPNSPCSGERARSAA